MYPKMRADVISAAVFVNNLAMKRLNLPLIADTLFCALCAFLVFFTALRYYTKSSVIALVTGIVACGVFGALTYVYISIKQDKKLLLSRDEKEKTLLALHLSLSRDESVRELIKKCFDGAVIRGKRIICGGVAYFCEFTMKPLSEDETAAVIKSRHEGKKVILCVKASPEAAALAENFSIEIIDINDVYAMLRDKSLLPEKYLYEGKMKTGFFTRLKSRFNRKICAPLFLSGAALLALSYFTFFPLYYIISGALMLVLSAVALFISAKKT